MSGFSEIPLNSSTSAFGALISQTLSDPRGIGFMVIGPGTTSDPHLRARLEHRHVLQTTSGEIVQADKNASTAIFELRRLTGLTWGQLAHMLGVTRRSLHFWASGKPVSNSNQLRLSRLLNTMKRLDRGVTSDNHLMLLGLREDGLVPFNLLAGEQYDRTLELVGLGKGRRTTTTAPLSLSSQNARLPLRPEELIDALQDRAHMETGKARVARSARRKK